MKPKKLLIPGAAVLFTLLAVWDAVAHHDGRLVYPMESYSFRASDIPMLLAVTMDACRIGLTIVFILLVLVGGTGDGRLAAETALAVLLAGISLSMALTIFLGVYLLYRYDREELAEEP